MKPRPKTARKTYQKKKKFTNAVTKVIRKKEPTCEVRYGTAPFVSLNGATGATSFHLLDMSSVSKGTAINQKLTSRLYVCGLQLSFTALNNHVAPKVLRVMVVQNRNPADTLDTTGFSDLYETTGFAPYTVTGGPLDAAIPINRDVLRIISDKKYTVKPFAEGIVSRKVYIPIKRYWTYKTIPNEFLCSSGRTFLIIQACDVTTPNTDAVIVSYIARLFYKNADNKFP